MEQYFYMIPLTGLLALVYALIKSSWVNKQDPGNEKMIEIGTAVREGAMAFLAREYKVLAVFVVAVGALLFFGNLSDGGTSDIWEKNRIGGTIFCCRCSMQWFGRFFWHESSNSRKQPYDTGSSSESQFCSRSRFCWRFCHGNECRRTWSYWSLLTVLPLWRTLRR